MTAASGAMRASLCQSTRRSFSPTRTSMRARRSMSAACSSRVRERLSEAIVMTGAASPRRSGRDRRGRPGSARCCRRRPARRIDARSTSMCSRPLSSDTTTPSETALGSTRSIASSRAGAFTVTSRRSTGFARCSVASTRAVSVPSGDSTTRPASAIRPTASACATQMTCTPAFASRTASDPPTAPGPRIAAVLFMPSPGRPRGSRPSGRNTRRAPRSLPRANPFPSP